MKEHAFRNQVSWMMFLFSILVIWVHSYNIELFSGGDTGFFWETAAAAETFLAVKLGQIAVPGFFLLSSYQFFRDFTWDKLGQKWKRRFFGVVLPYIVWNLLYYFGYVIATRLPTVRHVVGKAPVPLEIGEMLRAITAYAYAPMFWYLYQLILLFFFSPAIYLLMKRKAIGLLALTALAAAILFGFDTQHPNTDALLYYSAASYLALHHRELVEERGKKACLFAGLGGLCLAWLFLELAGAGNGSALWTVMGRLIAPASLWLILSFWKLGETRPWMRQSLFLYATHFMIVRFINKGTALAVRGRIGEAQSAAVSMLVFLFLPAAAILISYLIARLLIRYAPGIWHLLSGGRSLDEQRRKPI